MMEDSGLEAAIQTYSAQLGQVEAALTACQDSSEQTELLKLREDLLQLIELTESSLVSIKKSQLLASLEALPSSSPPTPPPAQTDLQQPGSLEQEFAAFYSELSESTAEPNPGSESEQDETEEEEEKEPKSGTKVRAPYYTSWGTLEYHNAMVVCPEEPNGDEDQVRVLYLHPTHKSMKPCPYFLEDKCRFHDSCRFSHGQVVCVSELRDFLEADLTNMEQGSSCLAKHDDGIWYPAKIIEIDGQFYTIKFDSLLLKEAVVEADGLIPPLRQDDSASSSDSDDDPESGYAKVFSTNAEDQAAVMVNSAEYCGWEAHTRGIGSKLLMKMGYELGKGLGKTLSGRVEPVQAVVLPKGCSLDLCTELPQRKARSLSTKTDATSCKRKKPKRRGRSTSARPNVFEFLNSKLGDQMDAGHSGSFRVQGVGAYQGDKSTKRSLNIQIFEKSEQISQVKKEIQRLSSSLSQKNGRDVAIVKRMEEKLSASRKLLQQLESQMQSIQSAQKRADTHKKMTEF